MKNNVTSVLTFLLWHKINVIFTICITAYCIVLFLNFNFFSTMANSDIIQFLLDGRIYHSLQLPHNIHASPLYPILITFVSYFFKDHVILHEIAAARFINIISTIGSLTLLYLLASKQSNKVLALGVVILAMLHPWTFMMAVGDYSETLFTFFTLLSLYFMANKKNMSLAFLLAGISFLVRNEGLLLFLSLFFVNNHSSKITIRELLTNFKKTIVISGFLIGGSIIIGWTLIFITNNLYSSKHQPQYSENLQYGYYFFYEIEERKNEIPELRFISNFPKFMFSFANYEPTSFRDPNLWVGIIIVAVLFHGFIASKSQFTKAISLYIILYLGIHVLFPAFTHRYFYPLLFISFLLVLSQIRNILRHKFARPLHRYMMLFLFSLIYCLLVRYVIVNFSNTVDYPKHYYDSHGKTSQLINSLLFNQDKTINIYMENPFTKYYFTGIEKKYSHSSDWIKSHFKDKFGKYHTTYFNKNRNILVRFIDVDHIKTVNCLNIDCIHETYQTDNPRSFFIHTKTDDTTTLSFYEQNLDETGDIPISNSSDQEVRLFTLKSDL